MVRASAAVAVLALLSAVPVASADPGQRFTAIDQVVEESMQARAAAATTAVTGLLSEAAWNSVSLPRS